MEEDDADEDEDECAGMIADAPEHWLDDEEVSHLPQMPLLTSSSSDPKHRIGGMFGGGDT